MTEIPDHKPKNVGSDIYGAERLALATLLKPALDGSGVIWFLDGGTLLGSYRNGKQIVHDDDFDLAAYFPRFRGEEDLVALRDAIGASLPQPYAVRIVTSYASKLEIYDTKSENYFLPTPYYKGADYHTVTVDVQIMTDGPDGSIVYLHDMLDHVRVPKDSIEPRGEIVCEGVSFKCPREPVRFLEAQYGYLGTDARYDKQTKLYVKVDTPEG